MTLIENRMKLIIILLFLIFAVVDAQEKYLIYFKDKGIHAGETLSKSSEEYLKAIQSLSEKCIERREKTLGENFISFEDLPVFKPYLEKLQEVGAKIVWELKWFNAVSCFLNANQVEFIRSLSFVKSIEKVKKHVLKKPARTVELNAFQKLQTSNYTLDYGPSLTQMEFHHVPYLHELNITGDSVFLGLLDAGFRWEEHPALKHLNVLDEYDFVYNDTDVGNETDYSHGTQVLSLAGGFEESNLVSPAFNAGFILAKTEDIRSEKNIEEDNFAKGIEWLEEKGVDIASTSLGYNIFDQGEDSYQFRDMNGRTSLVTRSMEMAFNKGVLTITSAGNEGNDAWYYITAPADGFSTIAVGAVNSNNRLADFSSRGPTYDGRIKPELVALGVNPIVADAYSTGYSSIGVGTSYSAPIVAGIAAQILSFYPHLNNEQLRQILLESGDNVRNPNNEIGYGLISAERALKFPNLKYEKSGYRLQKFIHWDEVDINSVRIHYSVDKENFVESNLVIDGMNYTVHSVFSGYNEGDSIFFYYTYNDIANTPHRDPAASLYSFVYSTLQVSLNTKYTPPVEIPNEYFLYQNYPNPFNGITRIKYSLPENSKVRIQIFNMLGEKVRTLISGMKLAGVYEDLTWDGIDDKGMFVSSGAYICIMYAKDFAIVKKMVYLK